MVEKKVKTQVELSIGRYLGELLVKWIKEGRVKVTDEGEIIKL